MFTVTRQKPYYQPGTNLVEISQGGIDYTGSNALCALPNVSGEFETFDSLADAMNAAITIRNAWNEIIRESNTRAKQLRANLILTPAESCAVRAAPRSRLARIGIGNTGGMGLEIEPSDMTDAQLRKFAREYDAKQPKCPQCGGFMPDDTHKHWHANDWDGLTYCSEQCATRAAEWEAILADEQDA